MCKGIAEWLAITLTTGADNLNIGTANTVDTVKALYNSSATSTFTVGDEIKGNGKTIVELIVDDQTVAPAVYDSNAPFVQMSGVDQLKVLGAKALSFTADASSWGSDISTISLAGADNFNLNIDDLAVKGSLTVSIAAASDSDVNVTGTMDGVDFSIDVENDGTDSVGAIVTAGLAGITATLGRDDDVYVNLAQTASDSAAAISVGDLTIGDISLNVGKDATADVSITNYAYNSRTATAGTATAGNLTVGNIALVAGDGGEADVSLYNSATALNGAATVGNLTIGNVSFQGGKSADNDIAVYNSAEATKGNAAAGNIVIGDVTSVTGESSTGMNMFVYNLAEANTSGNASVGNITAGNVSFTAADNYQSPDFYLENAVEADKGTATAGNIVVGNITMVGGDDGGEMEVDILNNAYVNNTGAATVGTITVGDISMTVGTSSTADVYISQNAYTAKGAATVGAVTIGNIEMNAGINGDANFQLDVTADGTAADKVGNVSVGNVTMYGQPDAFIGFEVNVSAQAGDVADVTVGDVDMTVDGDGSLSFYLEVDAAKNVGQVTIGDVNLALGTNATLYYFSVDVSAADGNVAGFTIGDVTIDAAKSASDSDQGFNVYASKNIGNIAIGDVTVNVAENGNFTSMTWAFEANTGRIGNITMGNTTMSAGVNANNWRYVDFTADDEIGDVSVGDVTLTAAKNGSAWLSHDYSASDDIGDITYGNISATANGAGAYAGFSLEADANGNTIGAVTLGNVSLTANGAGAEASAFVWLSDAGDTVGLATVGDITMSVSNTKTGASAAYVGYEMASNGSIVVGDVNLTAGAATADFADTAVVSALLELTTGNNLTVGNITVVGGDKNNGADNIAGNGDDVLMDNFDVLTNWLVLSETGSGKITIGNVDYSGYKSAATIDVSGFSGAAVIRAAQKDTDITDNKGKNEIYLGAGDDTVFMNATTSTTDKAVASSLDVIYNFTSGKDVISIATTSVESTFSYVSLAAADYAAFLTAANASMTNFGTDIYARAVGSDLFVAIDDDANGSANFVIKLAGITSVTAADFIIT